MLHALLDTKLQALSFLVATYVAVSYPCIFYPLSIHCPSISSLFSIPPNFFRSFYCRG